ncbi:MAG: MFS transporter [Castellaniella sp.]|uniref:MFS transporter n=1 Tax=Castellaniella sp. TaxID=1955812 RepID=UPI00120F901F|nr:MFS transporter [Castellaniella sp.]TAN25790.1 MAG: MFS transporter [Castellaniella sp.]
MTILPTPIQASSSDDYIRPTLLLVLTVALVGVFAFVQVYSVQSILPELQRDLHASVVQVGNTVGMTVLAVALMSPFVGMLSDAVGRKWLIVGSVFALAVPTALITQVQTVHGLLLLRFLQGLAVPGVSVVIIAYIGEEFRSGLMVRVMTIYVAGSVLGGFLGRFLMGHLTEFMAWRTAFGVMAALNLAGAVVVWRGLPASRHFVAKKGISSSLNTLGQLLRNPSLQVACALGFTVLFGLVGLFTFVNLHLAAAPYGFSSGALANIFVVYLLGVVITPMAGRLIPRFGVRRTVLVAVGISAAGVLLTLVQPAWGIVVALAIAACGVFITQSATMTFIAYRITSGRSLASGLYYTAYYCGGFSGAWVGGIAYTLGAWPGTVATLIATQAIGWLIAWRFMPRTMPGAR